MPLRWSYRILVLLLVLAVGGCGGDDPTAPAGDPTPRRSDNEDDSEEEDEAVEGPACLVAPRSKAVEKVVAEDFLFRPRALEASAGKKVTIIFENKGTARHSFTADAVDCDTGPIAPGPRVAVTFKMPAEPVEFFCSVHPTVPAMNGQISPR